MSYIICMKWGLGLQCKSSLKVYWEAIEDCSYSRNIKFLQLLDKACFVTKVSHDEYELEMSSWFAYQYQDSLPLCPLVDEDDLQICFE